MRGLRVLLTAFVALGTLTLAAAWQGQAPQPGEKDLIEPLRASGTRFWKGNLHTHSLWSDGDDFPEMIADWYRRHGYQFLTLSDHNVLSEGQRWVPATSKDGVRTEAVRKYLNRFGERWVERRMEKGAEMVRLKPLAELRSLLEEPGRFLMIPGEEITHRFARKPVHMNGINLRDVIRPFSGDGVSETIRINHRAVAEQKERTGQDMLVFLNHPNFGWGVKAEDMAPVDELRFFEIYNGHPGVRNYGDETHASTERVWDIILALRLGKLRLPVVYGLATDDAHRYHAFGVGKVNPGRGWIMVRAPYLTPEAIVRAMEEGDFYASTGVTLKDVRREGDQLIVEIAGKPGVEYTTEIITTSRSASLSSRPRMDGDKVLDVSGIYSDEIGKVVQKSGELRTVYQIRGDELYVRARIISTRAHPNPYQAGDVECAWTQPFLP